MVSAKILTTINVSLGLIAVILLLNLVGAELPTLGQAQYALDQEEPLCAVSWEEELTEWNDLDRCCLEAKKQIECSRSNLQEYDWSCQSGGDLKYLLNNKAYNYCRQLRIW